MLFGCCSVAPKFLFLLLVRHQSSPQKNKKKLPVFVLCSVDAIWRHWLVGDPYSHTYQRKKKKSIVKKGMMEVYIHAHDAFSHCMEVIRIHGHLCISFFRISAVWKREDPQNNRIWVSMYLFVLPLSTVFRLLRRSADVNASSTRRWSLDACTYDDMWDTVLLTLLFFKIKKRESRTSFFFFGRPNHYFLVCRGNRVPVSLWACIGSDYFLFLFFYVEAASCSPSSLLPLTIYIYMYMYTCMYHADLCHGKAVVIQV